MDLLGDDILSYQWNSEIVIQKIDDKIFYMNLENKRWLKTNIKLKNKLDYLVENNLIGKLNDEHSKTQIKKLIDSEMIIKDIYNKKKNIVKPSLYLMLTNKCNLECEYCCSSSSPNIKEDNKINSKNINKIVELINKMNIRKIEITGGEPLIHKDIIKIINEIHYNTEATISLQTNGILLTDNFISEVKEKVGFITISVDHLYKRQYSEFKENLENSLEKIDNKRICLSFVITQNNKQYVFDYLDMCAKYDCAISIKKISPTGRAEINKDLILSYEDYKRIYLEMCKYISKKKYDGINFKNLIFPEGLQVSRTCSGYGNLLAIKPSGDIFCCHLLENDEFYLGNISEQFPEDILKSINKIIDNKKIYRCFSIEDREHCKECEVKYFCNGECFALIYNNKNLLPMDCNIRKKTLMYMLMNYENNESFLYNLNKYTEYLIK